MITPAIYTGGVGHVRRSPVRHAFHYRVYSVWLDLDRLEETAAGLRLFSVDRFNVISVHRRDHGDGSGDPAAWVRTRLAEAGLDAAGHRIGLFCFPRVFGYVFNPIALFVGYTAAGEPGAIVYQVSNTFGDRHSYVAALSPGLTRQAHRQRAAKTFHVSPFNAVEGNYRFRLVPPGTRFSLAIRLEVDGAVRFLATHDARREPLSDTVLARRLVSHPALTAKVIGGIHWEALKLFAKGLRYHPRPVPPLADTSPASNINR